MSYYLKSIRPYEFGWALWDSRYSSDLVGYGLVYIQLYVTDLYTHISYLARYTVHPAVVEVQTLVSFQAMPWETKWKIQTLLAAVLPPLSACPIVTMGTRWPAKLEGRPPVLGYWHSPGYSYHTGGGWGILMLQGGPGFSAREAAIGTNRTGRDGQPIPTVQECWRCEKGACIVRQQ